MTHRSLMVHLDLDQSSEAALRVTRELADRFKSNVIGVAAGLPGVPFHAGGAIASSVLEADLEKLKQAIGPSAGHARSQLDTIASEARIDIIVAGAYGHPRLREWIFGGMTNRLLRQSSICALLAH